MALAVVNAIPDYHQDRLVGKRNLVVRLGRRRGVLALPRARRRRAWSSRRSASPPACFRVAVPRGAARAAAARRRARARRARTYESPRQFVPAIRAMVACYLVAVAAVQRGHLRRRPEAAAMTNRIDELEAPLFVSWQITRDCDLCCLHCCTESAPGKRLPDELDADEAMQRRRRDRPQRACPTSCCAAASRWWRRISSSSPKRSGAPGIQLKIETNGQRFDDERRRAARAPADPLDPGQPRRRHAGGLRAPAPGRRRSPRRMRPAARCARPGCRSRSRSRRRASTSTRPRAVISARARARRVPLQYRAAHAHRHRRAPLARAWRRRRGVVADSRALFTREAARRRHGDLLRAVQPRAKACAEARASPPATLLVLPERLGQGRGRAAARSAPTCGAAAFEEAWHAYRRAWHEPSVEQAVRAALADESRHRLANSWQPMNLISA